MQFEIRNQAIFYDLEFAQKHENKSTDDDENKNKPDMQAIKFNEKGKPDKLVFVESEMY